MPPPSVVTRHPTTLLSLRGAEGDEAILEGEILNPKHEILNKRKEESDSSQQNLNAQDGLEFGILIFGFV